MNSQLTDITKVDCYCSWHSHESSDREIFGLECPHHWQSSPEALRFGDNNSILQKQAYQGEAVSAILLSEKFLPAHLL